MNSRSDHLSAQLDAIRREHGPWDAYNIRLADDVYTMAEPAPDHRYPRVLAVLQLAADLVARPLDQLRVLDLGSLEGIFALEFASHGSEVVAIEGREPNNAKARLSSEALGLDDRTDWITADARSLDQVADGVFDVLLCLGLLYHLDGSDQLPFLRACFERTSHVMIVDTMVGSHGPATISDGAAVYRGRWYTEHDEAAPPDERLAAARSSLDNPRSFWLTLPSLINALYDVGFTTVLQLPPLPGVSRTRDRVQLVALKGTARVPLIQPNAATVGDFRVAETDERPWHKSQSRFHPLKRLLSGYLPDGVRSTLRTVRGRIGR